MIKNKNRSLKMRKTNEKNFIRVNMDCTPYIDEYNKDMYDQDKELAINYCFRAFNPVIFYNGIDAYYPDSKNPNKLGIKVPDNLMTKAIKNDLQMAWVNR